MPQRGIYIYFSLCGLEDLRRAISAGDARLFIWTSRSYEVDEGWTAFGMVLGSHSIYRRVRICSVGRLAGELFPYLRMTVRVSHSSLYKAYERPAYARYMKRYIIHRLIARTATKEREICTVALVSGRTRTLERFLDAYPYGVFIFQFPFDVRRRKDNRCKVHRWHAFSLLSRPFRGRRLRFTGYAFMCELYPIKGLGTPGGLFGMGSIRRQSVPRSTLISTNKN